MAIKRTTKSLIKNLRTLREGRAGLKLTAGKAPILPGMGKSHPLNTKRSGARKEHASALRGFQKKSGKPAFKKALASDAKSLSKFAKIGRS